jgi:hypothetical protein
MVFIVCTINTRVHDNVLQLKQDFPSAFQEMLDHLTNKPFEIIPRKFFRMVQYPAWEYKLPSFNRIYCKLYSFDGQRRVVIYHAGSHPDEGVPQPPDDNGIDWANVQTL